MTETYYYDAFGTLTSIQSLNENGILAEAETALSRFLYAGEQYDDVTGLYYLRARQYDTIIGRFIQEDTYLGDGRKLYVYVRNNPLKYVDPSGCDSVDIAEKVNGYYIEMRDSADPEEYIKKLLEKKQRENTIKNVVSELVSYAENRIMQEVYDTYYSLKGMVLGIVEGGT